jgi:hypothetical protein
VERVSKTYPLRKDRPRTFITRKGRKVGVDTARQSQPGKWEFSFADRPLNVIVLLAEDENGYLHDYVLPPKILQEHWSQFEREKGERGETVRVRATEATDGLLLCLRGADLPISSYRENYSALE